jgi:hypothetical protein
MWQLCKYLFYVSYCIERPKWKREKWAASSASAWVGVIIFFNLLSLISILEALTGIPIMTRVADLPQKTLWLVSFLLGVGFVAYFNFPGVAESISKEFSRIDAQSPQIKRHNLYIWIELIFAIAILVVCVVVNKAYKR